jgi:hypothetical protein
MRNIQDWRELEKRFGVTLTKDVQITQLFFCFGLQSHPLLPLDRQWICVTNKLVNQVNPHLQEWIIQGAHALRVVSAFTKLIEPLSNCPGLSESQ